MAQIPGVYIETTVNPCRYSPRQIDLACRIAAILNRGKFCLLEKPEND